MKEIEVKILEIDKQKIIQELTALGGKKIFDDEVTTVFLDFPDNRIHQMKDVLRLRKNGENVELTYKKVYHDKKLKIADEYSVTVSQLDATLAILQNLGLLVKQKMKKHRTSFKLDNIQIDIDKYQDDFAFIPEFMEIEGSEGNIKKYAGLLGFQQKDCLPWSTDELIMHYSPIEKEKV